MAAVIERGRTGVGRLVETSLIRAGVYAAGWDMAIQLKWGKLASPRGRKTQLTPLNNYFPTSDSRWLCVVTRHGADDWTVIANAAGLPELLDDPRFSSAKAQAQNGEALVEALDAGFRTLTLAEAGARLTAGDVIWAPLQAPRDVVEDPYALAAGCFVDVEDASGARFRAPASPARFPGADDGPKRPAPLLGQHPRAVLAEAGYGAQDIETLFADGAAA